MGHTEEYHLYNTRKMAGWWVITGDPVTLKASPDRPQTLLIPQMWHSTQLRRYVFVSQAFTRVSLTWERKKTVWRGITTVVCEPQRALSLISNQNIVFQPCSVCLSALKKQSDVEPWERCLVGFNEQTVLQRNTVTKGDGYWHIDSRFVLKARVRLTV